MNNPSLFARITKVDEEKRLVYTRIVKEENDKSDEIFDYESSVPHFKAWSAENFTHSGGKSYGNVRAMHGKSSAGVFAEPLQFVDAEKAIDGVIKVIDDQDWKKVLGGAYTGVSIGGEYIGDRKAEKSADGKDVHRYTAKPIEVSLVDSPCVPSARFFDVIKADGKVERREFLDAVKEIKVPGTPEQANQFMEALIKGSYTMVDAVEAIELLTVTRAAKAKGPSEEEQIIEKAIKIGAICKRVRDPELPLIELAEIAKAELTADESKALKSVDQFRDAIVAKLSKAMSAADKDRLQAAHDHISAMGASCGAGKSEQGGDLVKSVAALQAQVAKLEAQPAPHVVLRAVAKAASTEVAQGSEWKTLTPDELAKFAAPNGAGIDFDKANEYALTKAA